ncbi:DNA invertase Pin-like site-specific DNA recombinase [Prauserella shujinwangii]|uniref:DNA invertase Pin-like site-specific DNA recombinase n=1 Tax=Prauserella shujinwangii TaxID=1453103 RepID=A0A2T0LXC8_9PSEU|nr:recombinase family protein [Prauserella shujinwangii]PRX48668.1 DNA invertase Pin-like site-specific DNA recombinase [Prauserella shujinwangii]
MVDEPLELVLYLRVSKDSSGRERSPEDQLTDMSQDAQENRWRLSEEIYRDVGSASKFAGKPRGNFDKLIADLRADRFPGHVLGLWNSSRGSRQVGEWLTLVDLLTERRKTVWVHARRRLLDPRNAHDRADLLQDAVKSELAAAEISEQVRRTTATSAAAGLPHARCPYGYRRHYTVAANGKRVLVGQVPHEPEATVIRRIFDEIAALQSLRQIARALNEEGYPAPGGGEWTPEAVRRQARNVVYAGKRVHIAGRRGGGQRGKATLVDAVWPPIVTPERFYEVQGILTDPSRRTMRPGRHKHLLSMIARCAACDGPLSVTYSRGKKERPGAWYFCRDAGHVRVGQADLDALITDLLIARLAKSDAWEALAATGNDGELQTARNELAEAEAFHRELVAELTAKRMSPGAFSAAEPTALRDIERARERLHEVQTPPAVRNLLGGPRADVRERWEVATMVARREVVRELLTITVDRAGGRNVPAHERTRAVWKRIS